MEFNDILCIPSYPISYFLSWIQLHVQSVIITTKVVSSKTDHGEVYSITTLRDKISDLRRLGGFLRALRFSPK